MADTDSQQLRNAAKKGVIWTATEKFGMLFVQFVITILIARILTPADYGLVAMLAIFMGVAQTFLNSGFSDALIQKHKCSNADYSTVFYFNLAIGVFLYFLLFLSAPWIADYYKQPQLVPITRVYMSVLLINAFCIVQTARLTNEFNFKIQALVSIVALCISGGLGLYMAYTGWGVWSLVWQFVVLTAVRAILLWILSGWKPSWIFSYKSFNFLFPYGAKILATGLVNIIYINFSSFIIGKRFQASELGYFSRAQQFTSLPSDAFVQIMLKVFFPVISSIKDETERFRSMCFHFLNLSFFILLPVFIGVAFLSGPVIYLLLGEKWMAAAPLLSILSVGMLWVPLSSAHTFILCAGGHPGAVFKISLIKYPATIAFIIGASFINLDAVCWTVSICNFLGIFIDWIFLKKFINLSLTKQVSKAVVLVVPAILMAAIIALTLYFTSVPWIRLVAGTVSGACVYLLTARVMKLQVLDSIKYFVSKRKSNI